MPARVPVATEKAWPLFRGDPQAQGVAKTKLPDKPQLLWTMKVEGGAFESTPAIADGVVYLADMDGKLSALNLADGKEIWHHKIDGGYIASPADPRRAALHRRHRRQVLRLRPQVGPAAVDARRPTPRSTRGRISGRTTCCSARRTPTCIA